MAPVSPNPPLTPQPSTASGFDPAAVLAQLNRLLASAIFRASPQLSRFLRYAVEATLRGEGDQLKEYRLGVDVMGRPSSYEPHTDPIVRLEARRLRAKLREYYDLESRRDPIRIDIPKGGYAATFAIHHVPHLVNAEPPLDHPDLIQSPPPPTLRRTPSRRALLAIASLLVAGVLTGWAIHRILVQRRVAAGGELQSIAVLPLSNATGDPAQDYLADGVTDGILADLSRLPRLRVIGHSTVFRFRTSNEAPEQIGRTLHAASVLTGSLNRRGDAIGVQAQLIDVATGRRLWTGQFSRRLSDIRSMQEDFSREISMAIRPRLAGQDVAHLAGTPAPGSDAYLLYLRGRYAWNKRTEDGFNSSIDYFNQAIAKDPNYALAWTGLADSYMLLAEYQILSPAAALPRAKAAALKAVELDPSLSEAHTSLGNVRADEWDFKTAEKEFRTAIALNPSYATAHQWLAEVLMEEARYDEALAEIKTAQEIEPLSLIVNSMHGRILLFAGRTPEAIDQLHMTLEIEPNFDLASYDLGKAYVLAGRTSDAIEEMQNSINLTHILSERNAALAYAYVRAGRVSDARAVLASFLNLKTDYVSWFGIAIIYAALGDKDRAFDCLDHAYTQHSVRLRDLKVEPLLMSLHSDPRFPQLLRRIGFE